MKTLYKNGTIAVTEEAGIRSLWDGLYCQGRAFANNPSKPISAYMRDIIDYVKNRACDRVLVIGGGACLIPSNLYKNATVTIVEPNRTMLEVASQFFKFKPEHFNVYKIKGQDINLNVKPKFDCVIIDAYGPDGEAKELYCEDFYKKMISILEEDGVLITNQIVRGKNEIWLRNKNISIELVNT